MQRAVAREGSRIPFQPVLAKTAASAATLGAGGAAGSEGPVAVLGSAIGSWLGYAFRFDPARTKVLVGAGAAAGISAAFNAPLAGAFFALEEILGSLAVGAFPPVVVASVVAAVVSHVFLGNHPAFPIPVEYGYALQRELLIFYPFLGLLAGLVAALFVRLFFATDDFMRRLTLPRWSHPLIGGAVVGLLVLLSKGLLVGHGHLAVHLDVFGGMSWSALALLALGSMVATSITLSSGGSGGVFTPSLYVGAATGGAFGVALAGLFPTLHLRPEAYAIVGMGAVVAAATSAPITGILLVFEMTNDYEIVLPLMLTTVIANLVARRIEPDSLYSGWLRRRGERIQQGTDRDLLAGLKVADAFDPAPAVVGEQAPLDLLLDHLGSGAGSDLPGRGRGPPPGGNHHAVRSRPARPRAAERHGAAGGARRREPRRVGDPRRQPARGDPPDGCPRYRLDSSGRSGHGALPRAGEPGPRARAVRAGHGGERRVPRRGGQLAISIPAMPALNLDALFRGLAKGEIAPVYYLHGPEEILKDEAVRAILDRALDPAFRDFNLDQRSAAQLDPDDLFALCTTLPMMAERRVVVLRDLEARQAEAQAPRRVAALPRAPRPGNRAGPGAGRRRGDGGQGDRSPELRRRRSSRSRPTGCANGSSAGPPHSGCP